MSGLTKGRFLTTAWSARTSSIACYAECISNSLSKLGSDIAKAFVRVIIKKVKEKDKEKMKGDYFFFFTGFSSAAGGAGGAGGSGAGAGGASAFGSSFFSSISVVISSIGFGGGVVAIVQPIQAPMNMIATKATKTGTATTQNCTTSALTVKPIIESQAG